MNLRTTTALVLGVLALAATPALGQYSISWYAVATGGGTSSGSVFTITDIAGQSDAAAPVTGGMFAIGGGFLPTPAVSGVTANIELASITSGDFDRCITFEFYSGATCPNPVLSQTVTVHFHNGHASPPPSFNTAYGVYTCITARDRLHTLRRTASGAYLIPSGTDYTVNFTGAKALLSGNLNDDDFIDILDLGGMLSRFLRVNYGDGDTPCGYVVTDHPTRHADFDGDGLAGLSDYSFIATQFLARRDLDCCGNPLTDPHPIIDISVWDLVARGEWEMARTADLNHDGRLNVQDMQFLAEHGLPRCPADFDGMNGVRVNDVFAFLTAWFSGQPAADFNDDHRVSVQDIFDFVTVWFQGCL